MGWSGGMAAGAFRLRVLCRFNVFIPGCQVHYMESQNDGQKPVLGSPTPFQGITNRELGGRKPLDED